MIKSLHVSSMRAADLDAGHEHHALFQASTIGALLEGRFEGDVTIADLAERGDMGLGTLNGLDGEMIVIDGKFLRADLEGNVDEVEPDAGTPFAVVVEFDPDMELELEGSFDMKGLGHFLDSELGAGGVASAIRIDGNFGRVVLRSVPAQEKPYPTLVEVIEQQRVFELGPCEGSLVGFRFPEWSEGIEVGGYHLHFVDSDLARGGHVLDFTIDSGTVRVESTSELEVELPPEVDLECAATAARVHAEIERAERGGA